MGIAAHVYADTFSHYGFSGISSELNGVDPDTIQIDATHSRSITKYLRDKAQDFRERFVAKLAGTVLLGHGAVATYPDRPYLKWSYLKNDGSRLERNNPATFLEACEALHGVFGRFRSVFYPGGGAERASFASIKAVVQDVLGTEADAVGRVAKWTQAASEGKLGAAIQVPEYSPTAWLESLKASEELEYNAKTDRVSSPGYNFFAAADYHRNYVLKRLLPAAGLFVA